MKRQRSVSLFPGGRCLTAELIGRYASGSVGQADLPHVEQHLSDCSACRKELAAILQLLHPEQEVSPDLPGISSEELERALSLVHEVSQEERLSNRRSIQWLRGASAAAAAILLLFAGAWSVKTYLDVRKSEQFLARATARLGEAYIGSSPSGLRLSLPFSSAATIRDAAHEETLEEAENLFYQALALRDDMPEARLGLGSIYLARSQFSKARGEFQKVLDRAPAQPPALLARGVTSYEEALQTREPIERSRLLGDALADFDAVLRRDSASAPARYNRIWVLYESGRHAEALQEIDLYLARDSGSIWAARLKDLKIKLGMIKPEDIDRAIEQAAMRRDAVSLATLVRVERSEIPAGMRHALQRSLELEEVAGSFGPTPADLHWAAGVMQAQYADATGDRSYRKLLDFYAGLSPPQRKLKRALDARLQELLVLHNKGRIPPAIEGSRTLEQAFATLHDDWQLLTLHHLRGNCFYYRSEFKKSEAEYRCMLAVAESIGSADLTARALAALSSALSEQRRLQEALVCHRRLKEIAEAHSLGYWEAFAMRKLGYTYLVLNRLRESQEEYSSALSFAYRQRHPELLVPILEDLGLVKEQLKRPGDADALYREATEQLDLFTKQDPFPAQPATVARRATLLFKRAGLKLHAGDSAEAETLLRKALSLTTVGMRELACKCRLGLAQVCLSQSRLDEADTLLQESLEAAGAGDLPELIWQAKYLEGLVRKQRGEFGPALNLFAEAVSVLERMQERVPAGELRQSFMVGRLDPYKQLVSVAYHRGGDQQTALLYAERAKSLALEDYLASHDYDPQFVRKASEGLGCQPTPGMPAHHAGLQYFFSSEELLVFVIEANRTSVVPLPILQERVRDQVRRYRQSVEGRDETTFSGLARDLYDELVKPVLKQIPLEDVDTLVIFPDGPLHLLPFGGLRDERGQFLLEKLNLAYAPSAGILHRCLGLNRGEAGSRARSVLLLDGSGDLRGAGEELACLSRLYGGNARFLSDDGPGRSASDLMTSEILHFAGHAVLTDGRPSLVLRTGPGRRLLDINTIGSWQLRRNRLTNLSGCNTGVGPQADGEIPWGLVPAFLNAGAPALIVSLMPVDDDATRKLNVRFYELISGSPVSKAGALRQAQLSILTSERAYGRLSPAAWIPYVLIGDPR